MRAAVLKRGGLLNRDAHADGCPGSGVDAMRTPQSEDGGIEMSVDWQSGPSERGRTPLPERYKPKALRAPAAELPPPSAAADEKTTKAMPQVVDMRKLETELGRRRLDEIADVVRALTYGEMIEFAESMWSVRPDDVGLTEHNLPEVLYRWSTLRQS
jgi:hypothetical protein